MPVKIASSSPKYPADSIGVISPAASSWWLADRLFLLGLLSFPFQFVQVGILQPVHIWVVAAFPYLLVRGGIVVSGIEFFCYLAFIAMGVAATTFGGYNSIKAPEQLLKFAIIYPSLYLLGRAFGNRFSDRQLPYGEVFVVSLLAFEFVVQLLAVPVIYQEVSFMKGVLHGTFKERAWIALYFFYVCFLLFLKKDRDFNSSLFLITVATVTTLLSGSKVLLVMTAITFLFTMRGTLGLKLVVATLGLLLFVAVFQNQFTEAEIRVRVEQERGLALVEAISLVAENLLGYGFGFVEYHFSNISVTVRGLGAGTNSIFNVPLDLLIIAGVAGPLFWLVFFCGIGVHSFRFLAPVAACSLLNPLHQSEFCYFFNGMIVSMALAARSQAMNYSRST